VEGACQTVSQGGQSEAKGCQGWGVRRKGGGSKLRGNFEGLGEEGDQKDEGECAGRTSLGKKKETQTYCG